MLPVPTDAIGLYARLTPKKIAATDMVNGQAWTYAEFDAAVSRMAGLIRSSGCAFGDRLVVVARNTIQQVIMQFGCSRAGVIYTPLNWRLSPSEIAELIQRAEPSLILADEASASLVGDTDFRDFNAFVAEGDGAEPLQDLERDPERIALMLFTSGTSGKPKGVMLSERFLDQVGINFARLTEVNSSSCFLGDAPMFHVIGMVTNLRTPLVRGGSIRVSDGFVAERTLGWLADKSLGITHYIGVPQMIESFRKTEGFRGDLLAHMTAVISGGAPHAPPDVAAWLDEGVSLVQGFGMTESGTVTGMPTDRELIRSKLGSCGIPAQQTELRIVDSEGNDLPTGEAGELWTRGPNLMSGYWRDEEQTAAVMTADGWFRTGDIARCDEDGYFWIVDRKKDMFISGGENVYPAEIEALITDYPGLKESAVVGVPDERWGEVGCLAVVLKEGAELDDEAIIAYLRERLAGYKVPKQVARLEALPRTATGKLQKAELRKLVS